MAEFIGLSDNIPLAGQIVFLVFGFPAAAGFLAQGHPQAVAGFEEDGEDQNDGDDRGEQETDPLHDVPILEMAVEGELVPIVEHAGDLECLGRQVLIVQKRLPGKNQQQDDEREDEGRGDMGNADEAADEHDIEEEQEHQGKEDREDKAEVVGEADDVFEDLMWIGADGCGGCLGGLSGGGIDYGAGKGIGGDVCIELGREMDEDKEDKLEEEDEEECEGEDGAGRPRCEHRIRIIGRRGDVG